MQSGKPAFNLFLAVFGLWLLWSGPYSLPGLAAEGSLLILAFGLISSMFVVWLCHAMGIVDEEIVPLELTWRTLGYIPWLTVEVIKSNIDVIRRIVTAPHKVRPVVGKIRASQRTDLGRVTYANSITLTPGTLTLDASDDQLTVHALSADGIADLEQGEMDRRVRRLEGPFEDSMEEHP
jgi:multicomponent Na+:H+ antiporter subunit E